MAIWFRPFTLADLDTWGAGTLQSLIGLRFSAIGDDWLEATLPVDERTHQPYGLLHGGASAALAETIGSAGANLCVDPAAYLCVGQSLTANHVKSVRSGLVTGRGTPVHRGRRSQVWQIEIRDPQGALVCHSTLTVAVLDRR